MKQKEEVKDITLQCPSCGSKRILTIYQVKELGFVEGLCWCGFKMEEVK